VVSDEIYFAVVRHGYVDADTYCPLAHVRVADRPHRGWVHVPAAEPAPVATITEKRAADQVTAIIGRNRVTRAGPAAG
jgi:hypothetical protein